MKVGDRVRWRARDRIARWSVVRWGPWRYGRVRRVFHDGTARIVRDDGAIVDRPPRFYRTEVVSAIDQLAALAAKVEVE